MPGPQSFTPRPVRPSRPKRRFTVSQANSALPLVRRIVGDIVKTHGQVLRLQAEIEQSANAKDQAATQTQLTLLIYVIMYAATVSDVVIVVIVRLSARNAAMCRRKPSSTKESSRSGCTNSFTDWMLV